MWKISFLETTVTAPVILPVVQERFMRMGIYGQIDVECGVGQVDLYLQDDAKYYKYDVDCGVGEVSIDGENYKRYLQHRKEHVHHGALSGYSDQTIDIDCGVGEVNVNFQ